MNIFFFLRHWSANILLVWMDIYNTYISYSLIHYYSNTASKHVIAYNKALNLEKVCYPESWRIFPINGVYQSTLLTIKIFKKGKNNHSCCLRSTESRLHNCFEDWIGYFQQDYNSCLHNKQTIQFFVSLGLLDVFWENPLSCYFTYQF